MASNLVKQTKLQLVNDLYMPKTFQANVFNMAE